jgi:hypothetical protein
MQPWHTCHQINLVHFCPSPPYMYFISQMENNSSEHRTSTQTSHLSAVGNGVISLEAFTATEFNDFFFGHSRVRCGSPTLRELTPSPSSGCDYPEDGDVDNSRSVGELSHWRRGVRSWRVWLPQKISLNTHTPIGLIPTSVGPDRSSNHSPSLMKSQRPETSFNYSDNILQSGAFWWKQCEHHPIIRAHVRISHVNSSNYTSLRKIHIYATIGCQICQFFPAQLPRSIPYFHSTNLLTFVRALPLRSLPRSSSTYVTGASYQLHE